MTEGLTTLFRVCKAGGSQISFNISKYQNVSDFKNTPPLIAEVPAVIVTITAMEVEDATSSGAQEFSFITHDATVWTKTDGGYSSSHSRILHNEITAHVPS